MPDDEGGPAVMEGSSSSTGGATSRRAPRFSWTPAYEETFFRSLCESVSLGLRENNTFKPEAWDRAMAALRDAHGAHANKSHLINKADNARKRFRMWRGLREDPRFFYTPVTRRVTGSEDDWRAHLEKEPLARALRGRPFEFEEYLELLYPDVVGSGGMPKRVMKPKRRQDGEASPTDDAGGGANVVFLEPDIFPVMGPQGASTATGTPQLQPPQLLPSTQTTTSFPSPQEQLQIPPQVSQIQQQPALQIPRIPQLPQPLQQQQSLHQTMRLTKSGRATLSTTAASDSMAATALTPPDETSHGRKRGLSLSNVADTRLAVAAVPAQQQQQPSLSTTPTSSTTPTAAAASRSRLSMPMTNASQPPPEKRRRSNAVPRPSSMASTPPRVATAEMAAVAAPVIYAPATTPTPGLGNGADMERVLGEHKVLLERVLDVVQTQLVPPRWSEQAMDIFLRDFADEEMDLQVKIAEKVLADDNKAMVFCKFSPCLRSHWVKRLRELINSRPNQ